MHKAIIKIAAISWPPPLISQLLSPRLFEGHTFFMHAAWLFLHVYIYLIKNSQAVKKVRPPQKAMVKKDVKSKEAAKKWL